MVTWYCISIRLSQYIKTEKFHIKIQRAGLFWQIRRTGDVAASPCNNSWLVPSQASPLSGLCVTPHPCSHHLSLFWLWGSQLTWPSSHTCLYLQTFPFSTPGLRSYNIYRYEYLKSVGTFPSRSKYFLPRFLCEVIAAWRGPVSRVEFWTLPHPRVYTLITILPFLPLGSGVPLSLLESLW